MTQTLFSEFLRGLDLAKNKTSPQHPIEAFNNFLRIWSHVEGYSHMATMAFQALEHYSSSNDPKAASLVSSFGDTVAGPDAGDPGRDLLRLALTQRSEVADAAYEVLEKWVTEDREDNWHDYLLEVGVLLENDSDIHLGVSTDPPSFFDRVIEPAPESFFDVVKSTEDHVEAHIKKERVPAFMERIVDIPAMKVIGMFEGFATGNADLTPRYEDFEYHCDSAGVFRAWSSTKKVACSMQKTNTLESVLLHIYF